MDFNELKYYSESLKKVEGTNDNLQEETNNIKYGRNRLFNTKAMLEIVNNNNYLKNIYDNLKEKGKDIFGYHFNEIILSMIFVKYIKSNKLLFNRYLKLRRLQIHKNKKNIVDKKIEKLKQQSFIEKGENQATNAKTPTEKLNEVDMSSIGGEIPVTPSCFAKDVKNWRLFQNPMIKGVIFLNNPLQNKDTKFLMEQTIEIPSTKDEVEINDINIISVNGINTDSFIKSLTEDYENQIINVIFTLFNDEYNKFVIPVNLKDYYTFIENIINPENNIQIKEIISILKQNNESFVESLKAYVLSEIDDSAIIDNDDENEDMFEYTNKSYNEPKTLENTNTTNNMNTQNINEDALPSALVKLKEIQDENKKNLETEIKELNNQVQNYLKDGQDVNTPFEYDYDNDAYTNDEVPKYKKTDEVKEFEEMNSGRGLEDIDYDIKPDDKFIQKIKDSIGEDGYKKVQEKAKLRKMEKLAARDVETEINDFEKTPSWDAKLKGMNESISAKYNDLYNTPVFVKINLNESLTETNLENIDKGSFRKLNYKGFGSLCESTTSSVNESKLDTLEHFDFYINLKTNEINYVLKESTQPSYDKNEINKLKSLCNYDGSKNFKSTKKRNLI